MWMLPNRQSNWPSSTARHSLADIADNSRALTGWSWCQLIIGEEIIYRFPTGEVDPVCWRSPKMARVEAALLVADEPLSLRRLSQVATLADAAEAGEIIELLNEALIRVNSPFRVERVASGYQLLTLPVFSNWLNRLHQRQAELKLSSPALETLAIVAYRQPITRADVEAIRGVQSSEMLKQLMERGLVRIGGEDDSLGRPYLYETTRKFLELFGLRNLDDLPGAESLRVKQKRSAPEESPAESEADETAEDAVDQPEDVEEEEAAGEDAAA